MSHDFTGTGRRVLIIVQNLPVPFDRRVWQEACTLADVGYNVSIICPKGKGYEASYEVINNIHIYRHPLPLEAKGALGYALEYCISLFWEWVLAWKVFFTRGFDAIHACNPPDTIFLLAGFFKYCMGKKFLFDHHDINPELYEAKFARRDGFYKLMLWLERLTFAVADISIATNNSYREIAITRGKMLADRVFVVRSGPNLERMKILPAVERHKKGKRFLIGYVGVIGQQEGIGYLIKAISYILHTLKRDDIYVAIIGDGPALADMRALAEQECVQDNITFTGRVNDALLLEILNTADICVNPDEFNAMNDKSTMNKIMEYMALGKAIVQFDVTEGRFSAGDASLYAKPNDAEDFALKMAELLDNTELRSAMGERGRLRVERERAWQYEAPKLLAAYEALFALPNWGKRYRWLYYRLRAMSAAEIVFRVGEVAKHKWDKMVWRCGGSPHLASPGGRGIQCVCHQPGTSRVFLSPRERLGEGKHAQSLQIGIKEIKEKIANLTLSPETEQHWHHQYKQARSGRYHLLGKRWPGETSARKWQLDPVTGKEWPQHQYCFDINYRHAPELGDVKYVWELSRLQYLQPIAVLAYKRDDKEMALFCLAEIDSWIDSNPFAYGVHWVSGIELALRAVSIIFVCSLLNAHITPAQQEKIAQSLQLHGRQIARYRSAYSSANNHLLAEALGLLIIGTTLENPHWKHLGWKILCEEINKQILDDGAGAELSLAYASFSVEIFTIGVWLAEINALTIPANFRERIMRAEHFLQWFKDTAGNSPHIGDDDNGVVLKEAALRELFAQSPIIAREGVCTFDKGGYSVARFRAQEHDFMLAIDHGRLGYLSIAAHAHADALAVWLHIGGQPVLVDAGTYLYHSGGAWRDYFRSTRVHNTLCIQGADSSVMTGPFNWSHKATATLESSECTESQWRLKTSHDGCRKRLGAVHERLLEVKFESGCAITDSLIADKPHTVEIGFLIHPSLTIIQKENEVHILRADVLLLWMSHEGGLAARLTEGWYSEYFGHKTSATRIVFYGKLAPGQLAITQLKWA